MDRNVRCLLVDMKQFLSAYLVSFIFSTFSMAAGIIVPTIIGKIVDEGIQNKNIDVLKKYCILVLIIQAIGCISIFFTNIIYAKMRRKYITTTKEKVLNKVLRYSSNKLSDVGLGKLLNIVSTDVEAIATAVTDRILQIVQDSIIAVVMFIVLLKLDAQIFSCIILVQIILYLVNKKFNSKIQVKIRRFKENSDIQTQFLQNIARNIAYIIKSANQKYCINKYMKKENDIRENEYNIDKGYMANSVFATFMSTVILLIVWGIGGYKTINGMLSIGTLYAISSYSNSFVAPIMRLLQASVSLNRAKLSIDRVYNIVSEEAQPSALPKDSIHKIDTIELNNVSFAYNENQDYILKNLSFSILPKKVNVIVGKSGCGKSTIINLLVGYCKINSGNIIINSENIERLDIEYIRKRTSYLSQDVAIFNDSILNNITLGEDVDFNKVVAISQVVGLHDYIISLEEGYETIIEPNGSNLSGGQCQKIAIMRTLIKDADIIVLDEATSNLDNISQSRLCDYILNVEHDRTFLIISHDLETIKEADNINFMSEGKIAESGTHLELLRKQGQYYKMYTQLDDCALMVAD